MTAVTVDHVEHRYGDRQALAGLSFDVATGEIFGLLGPNGGGKTTLFRLLSTSLPLQTGAITVLGLDVSRDSHAVRQQIGVTFQSPSLDRKLTVSENLQHQGHLYGLMGHDLRTRMDRLLEQLGLSDRRGDIAGTLSGGLQRRVEIAKGMLHDPQLLLLDEPSTGLDPGARHDLWRYLGQLRAAGVTVLVTTHLMEEAEKCDRLGILDNGALVAIGTPMELRSSIGGDCVTLQSPDPDRLESLILDQFRVPVQRLGESLRIEHAQGHELLRDVVAAAGDLVRSCTLGKPTLEDVFIQRTGHKFWEADAENGDKKASPRKRRA
ncbi:Daunorubicin/doxorubicin resistance ATP-binding protein DrrA [Caulifigura coniformis]|uniref:Daunorubicin/doxorubicin resistance ATP-binding protein DrrA n=1 Tax=Caulifigura coniformis TaxID=2527983 RepID=A0A517SKV7_9PLAN|nr:ATP-binding cassette domain-containing protein [Caulifigura coniformis]QDT56756.1 Daunorubicin/doxorubicin resistance ATP-binding protein DrrA [Caulifigura coniformis]